DAVGAGGADGVDETGPAHDASPLEGVGYLVDQVHDALFGDDDEASAAFEADPLTAAFETDPADLASDTDLDLTGDGVVNHADLLEAEHPLDFHVGGLEGPHG
ncbi:MAG TPA: hypothetical protein VF015_04015, partial [Acidimicrobiales bacterium]